MMKRILGNLYINCHYFLAIYPVNRLFLMNITDYRTMENSPFTLNREKVAGHWSQLPGFLRQWARTVLLLQRITLQSNMAPFYA